MPVAHAQHRPERSGDGKKWLSKKADFPLGVAITVPDPGSCSALYAAVDTHPTP